MFFSVDIKKRESVIEMEICLVYTSRYLLVAIKAEDTTSMEHDSTRDLVYKNQSKIKREEK